MALQGNLRDFPLTQLLNLIYLAHKSGLLEAKSSSENIQIWFREGKLAYAQKEGLPVDLINILQRRGRLNDSQVRVLQRRFGQESDKVLGLQLVNAGYILQREILEEMQAEYSAVLSHLFSWTEGDFHFDNTCPPPDEKILVRAGLENLILESSRGLQEAEQLQAEIPNLEAVLKFTEHPGTNIRKLNLSPAEWKAVSFINAKNTIRQIGRAVEVTDLEVRKIVYGLLQAGIVEYQASQRDAVPFRLQTPQPAQAAESIAERKSLINRLITHIRTIQSAA